MRRVIKTMTATKTTKRDYYEMLLKIDDVASSPELTRFVKHEIELLDRKNKSRSGELTETQKENLELANEILDYFAQRKAELTVKEIREHFGITAREVTLILRKLENVHELLKRGDKRISYVNRAE